MAPGGCVARQPPRANTGRRRRPRATRVAWLLASGLAALDCAAAGAADLADALVRDGEVSLRLRSHYLERDKSWAADSVAWAAGGWLGYRSGWIDDALRLGLTGYTSQKLYGPADQDGAAVLAPGQRPYTVLGEAYGALRLGGQTLSAGRFLVNQYEVNPQDTRMSPRTFQGVSLTGRVAGVEYFAGQLDKMKTRNSDRFVDVATVAGAPAGVSRPMWLLSLRSEPAADLKLGFAAYHVRDVLASGYADASRAFPLGTGSRLSLGGQLLYQASTGDRLLIGAAFETWTAGLRADWTHGPYSVSGIAMKTGDGAAYRTPYGSWPGYTSRIINNFNRAGERAWGIDAALDGAALGAPGLAINASASFGDQAVDATTGAVLSENAEYDVTLDYRFAGAWPSWAKPLHLRARLGRFEQRLAGTTRGTTETHLILNYTVPLK